MVNLWNEPGFPHTGWTLLDTVDLRAGGSEAPYEVCQMCGHERIRYVHIVTHPELDEFRVGCVCAERMTGDSEGPRRREQELRSREGKRERLLKKEWKISKKGNRYLKYEGHILTIRKDPASGSFMGSIDDIHGKMQFDSPQAAKAAVIAAMFVLQDRGKW